MARDERYKGYKPPRNAVKCLFIICTQSIKKTHTHIANNERLFPLIPAFSLIATRSSLNMQKN